MYPLLRRLLFTLDAEKAHYVAMNALSYTPGAKAIAKSMFSFDDSSLRKDVFGLSFKNPVGLGAGFDKNGVYLEALSTLGFGFVEVGTVTPLEQPGNEKPRLFRLPKDKALINRMGFNNEGADALKKRLEVWKNHRSSANHQMIVGCNIGKNKITANEDAWKDYNICFTKLHDSADYFVVNVSSPNTPGLRALQDKDALYKILSELQDINYGLTSKKTLLLKIAPDLTTSQLDDIVSLVSETKLDGLVATNTTISQERLMTSQPEITNIGAGGLSGKPLRERSTEVVSYLAKHINSNIPIVASGGIFSGNDAKEKLDAGAALVQVWTGFIYEGPGIVKNICRQLLVH
jgi:dihydroorotate dehydrogenase